MGSIWNTKHGDRSMCMIIGALQERAHHLQYVPIKVMGSIPSLMLMSLKFFMYFNINVSSSLVMLLISFEVTYHGTFLPLYVMDGLYGNTLSLPSQTFYF
jgi:hypothetical protein